MDFFYSILPVLIKKLKPVKTVKWEEGGPPVTLDLKKIEAFQVSAEKSQGDPPQSERISHIITVKRSKSNTTITGSTFEGGFFFSHCAGEVGYVGKRKIRKKKAVLKSLIEFVTKEYWPDFRDDPTALHFSKVPRRDMKRVTKDFRSLGFNIKAVRVFGGVPYNGIRQRKLKRKKRFRSRFV